MRTPLTSTDVDASPAATQAAQHIALAIELLLNGAARTAQQIAHAATAPSDRPTRENKRYWFSTRQAAEYTGASAVTISNACRSGELRAGQPTVGGHWRIHRDDLDAWLRGEKAPA